MQANTPEATARRWSGARIVAVVTGSLATLVAIGLLTVGGALLWGNAQKDERGYLATDSEEFSTGTHALVSEDLDVDLAGAGWVMNRDDFGNVRLEVTPHTNKPVFVGIAPTRDVSGYLRRTAHTSVTDVSYSPFRASYADHGGGQRPARPADERFWTASAHGAGPQTVTWDVDEGSWSIVVMNADGSPGIDAGISAGAKVPFLAALAWGVITAGLVTLAGAGMLMFLALRTPRRRAGGPAAPAATAAAA